MYDPDGHLVYDYIDFACEHLNVLVLERGTTECPLFDVI